MRPARSATSTSSAASAPERPSGFSPRTCLPALSREPRTGTDRKLGSATETTSISGCPGSRRRRPRCGRIRSGGRRSRPGRCWDRRWCPGRSRRRRGCRPCRRCGSRRRAPDRLGRPRRRRREWCAGSWRSSWCHFFVDGWRCLLLIGGCRADITRLERSRGECKPLYRALYNGLAPRAEDGPARRARRRAPTSVRAET